MGMYNLCIGFYETSIFSSVAIKQQWLSLVTLGPHIHLSQIDNQGNSNFENNT